MIQKIMAKFQHVDYKSVVENYSILPMELKITDSDKKSLDLLFENNSKLVSILQSYLRINYNDFVEYINVKRKRGEKKENYSHRVTRFLRSHGYTINGCEDCTLKHIEFIKTTYFDVLKKHRNVIKDHAHRYGIIMKNAWIDNQFDKVVETITGTAVKRTFPTFNQLRDKMRIRISNNNGAKFYNRDLTFVRKDGVIAFKLNLFKGTKPIRGFIGFDKSFEDRYRYQILINALDGVGGYGVGDPSELCVSNDGKKFILNLGIKYTHPRPEKDDAVSPIVIGVDVGVARWIAVGVARRDERILGNVKMDASKIIPRYNLEMKKHGFKKRDHMRMRGGVPYKRGELGMLVSRRTRLGKTWFSEFYKYVTYQAVNKIIALAIDASLAEKTDLKNVVVCVCTFNSFKRRKKHHADMVRKYRAIYNRTKDPNIYSALQHHLDSVRACHVFKYGVFIEDLKNEAMKNDITIKFVSHKDVSYICSKCGIMDKKNRNTRRTFRCVNCGHTDDADFNAAINISYKLKK